MTVSLKDRSQERIGSTDFLYALTEKHRLDIVCNQRLWKTGVKANDKMQQEIATTHPELNIDIIGINEFGEESDNIAITSGRDLPWLQDVDNNQNGQSDVWRDLWQINQRDVVVVNGNNEIVEVYNLTINDLANSVNFNRLMDIIVDAAMNE